MKKKLLCTGVFCLLAIGVAGCGDSGGNSTTTTTTTPTPAFEDQFGAQFGNLYRASANTDPANVNDTDVVALSLTTEPVTVPGG